MAKTTYKISGIGKQKQIRSTLLTTRVNLIAGWQVNVSKAFDAAGLLSDINEGIDRANQIIAARLGQALDEALESAVWAWNDGSPRNIIDTGKLKASRNIVVSGRVIKISYSVPYAGIVHFGGYILPYGNKNAEKVYLPARPWVDSVVLGRGPVPQFDFETIYAETITQMF